jgi:hypothetical protein
MNTAKTIATVFLMASVTIAANSQPEAQGEFRQFASVDLYRCCDLNRVEDAYLRYLQHSNLGVVESAIGNVARFKIARPECSFEDIQEELKTLAVEGPTPSIRYKASLASLLCDKPELFLDFQEIDFANSEELFTTIAQRLNEATLLLVSR